MYLVAWRHNANCLWEIVNKSLASEQDARQEINRIARYDMARREYRIIPIGLPDNWIDPVAQEAK